MPTLPENLPFEHWHHLMMDFWRQGGKIARTYQSKITPNRKADNSIVTEADLAISALAQDIFSPLKNDGHLILDEETISQIGPPTQELFDQHDFIWAIDPIDGTSSYAARRATYAISVGLMYKGLPIMGGIYMPRTDELFFYDEQKPLLIEHPFSTRIHTETLEIMTHMKGHISFDVISAFLVKKYNIQNLPSDITATNSTAVSLAYTAAGRFCGAYFKASIWDMAGAWPLLQSVGAKLCHFETGKPLEKITPNLLDETWCFKDTYICCNPKFFKQLRGGFEAY